MPNQKEQSPLLDIGLGGHGLQFPPVRNRWGTTSSSLSGYYTDPDGAAEHHKKDLSPGAWVVDKRAALRSDTSLAFKSPLASLSIPERAHDPLDKGAATRMLPGLSGGFDTIAAAAIATPTTTQPGPLDYVGLLTYVDWWRDRGARVGRWNADTESIDWESEVQS